jgi:DNA-binding CsgD family transcriptional regulator
MIAVQYIRASDVRRLLQLQGEIFEIRDLVERSHHMIDGICALIGASGGGVALSEDFHPRGMGSLVEMYTSGFAAAGDGQIVVGELQPSTARDPAISSLMNRWESTGSMTLRRRELASDTTWYRSDYVNLINRASGIDDSLYTIIPGPTPGSVFGMGFYRQWGQRPFNEDERDLVDAFQQGAAGIHRSIFGHVRLSPRLKQTLDGLLEGLSEKEIAARLRISVHTVHDYVKTLHVRFRVSSRAQLVAVARRI